MSEESNKNNLEDFFRNSLKEYSENPSNDLWDRIEAGIPPKPSRRLKPVYFLVFLLLFLAVGFAYEYFQFKNKMDTVKETVTLQKQELNQLKSQLEVVKDHLQAAKQSADNENTEAATAEEIPTQQALSNNFKSNESIKTTLEFPKSAILVAEDKNERVTSETVIAETQTLQAIPQAELKIEEPALALESLTSLDFLAAKPIVLQTSTIKDLPLVAMTKSSKKAFSLELYASAFRTFTNNSHKAADQPKVKNWDVSSDYGLLFNLGMNKNWDIQIGVGYNKMIINDAVSTELNYARDELDPARGTYTSYYSYTIDTPSGDVLVNSTLSNQRINDGSDFEEGDQFQLDLQYRDEINYFQLPVYVRYKIGSGKYRFTLKGGFIQKFLLNEKIKLSTVDADSERLENDMSHVSSDQRSAANTSIDALFGAGVEFRMTLRNSIHLQSRLSYSLKEIYPGIKPLAVGLQLGLQHQLGR